ncbi:MAG: immunoglobulin-like domain-containing protein, partial [Rectinemataceae bacterium]
MRNKGKTMTRQSLALGTLAFLALGCSDMIYSLRPLTLDTNKATAAGEQILKTIEWAAYNSEKNVYADFLIPEELAGATITWPAQPAAATGGGKVELASPEALVTRQAKTFTVKMTATIKYGLATITKEVSVRVKGTAPDPVADPTDKTAVATVVDSLTDGTAIKGLSASGTTSTVTTDLKLPTTGPDGTSITWSSSDPSVIGPDGQVIRQKGKARTVTLTAIVKDAKGNPTTVTYTVEVPAAPAADSDVIAADKAAAAPSLGSGELLSHVTSNISLPTAGPAGSVIKWTSSNPAVIAE